MRRFFIALSLALLVLPLGGCLKSKATYVLKKDGSGTISSRYAVSLGKMRELLSTVLMMMNPDAAQKLAELEDADLPDPVAPNWLRLLANDTKGYDLTKVTSEVLDGGRTTTVDARFQSLEAAAKGGAFFTFSVSLSRVKKSEEAPNGAWKLVLKDILLGAESQQMGGMSPAQMAPMFETQLDKISLTNVITLPTKILVTNGKKNEKGDTVSWNINYEKIVAGKDVSMSVIFEAAEDLKLKPFTHTPDLNALIKRMQQGAPKPKPKAEKPADTKGEGEGGGLEPDAPKSETPKSETPKADTAKPDAPKPDAPKPDAPKSDTPESGDK